MATFFGTNGNDNINGAGFRIIFGLGGNDTILSDPNFVNSEIYGGDGDDQLTLHPGGGTASGLLDGGAGDDSLQGANGADSLFGGSGNDFINSVNPGAANDYIDGGDGQDTLIGGGVIVGGSGSDLIGGSSGDDRIYGGADSDHIEAGTGSDDIYGGGGSDHIVADGNDGTDRIFGGDGVDVVSYVNLGASATVDLATGVTGGSATGDLLVSIENLIGSSAADLFTGDGGSNVFGGRGGADVLDGGGGIDTASYFEKTTAVVVTLNGSNFVTVFVNGIAEDSIRRIENLNGGSGNDSFSGDGLANIFQGGAGNDFLFGAGGNDLLFGDAGNDTLAGGDGNDIVAGGQGADTMFAGAGNDTYDIDNVGDVVDESVPGSSGIDTVQASISFNLADAVHAKGAIERLTLTGNANLDGIGNGLANVITGNAGNNALLGQAGNDTLIGAGGNDAINGGTGADTMRGGAGNDVYVVDNAGDVVDESIAGSGGVDSVFSSIGFSLADNAHAKGTLERLTLTGSADINGTGNAAANIITGNAGANILNGRHGNDNLTGGLGADGFLFNTALDAAANLDTIADFVRADDSILLDNAVFTKLKKEGVLKKKFFEVGKKAGDKNDYVLWNKKTKVLSYDADGSKKKFDPVAFAHLGDGAKVKADDLFVV